MQNREFKRGIKPTLPTGGEAVAKDGTNRGGARVGAGAKKKPLADKIADGNPGKRKLTVIDFESTADLEGQPMPKPSALLSATQKDGKKLIAAEIYEATWKWLSERRCTALVYPQQSERLQDHNKRKRYFYQNVCRQKRQRNLRFGRYFLCGYGRKKRKSP